MRKSHDLKGFYHEVMEESDRGAALLCAALLDEQLFQFLKAYFVDDAEAALKLMDPEKPLGSFRAKIHLAYCMGLLTEDAYRDLLTISQIRNDFAHKLHGLTFNDLGMVEQCDKLRVGMKPLNEFKSARDRFLSVANLLHYEMGIKVESLRREWAQRCQIPAMMV